jgi:Rrf2 family protein
MFSITKKANYGILALLELAENYHTGRIQIKDIAQKRNIPKQYLDQIFNRLVRTGLIKSYRGNKGGYKLADDPSNISLIKILELLEGEIELSKNNQTIDSITDLFIKAEKEIKKTFDITLTEILQKQQQYKSKTMFYI